MANKLPTNYVNLAGLCINVASNWLNRYPTYTVKFTNYTDFGIEANLFQAKALANAMQDNAKSGQSTVLKLTNLKINDGIKALKKYIQAEYPLEKNFAAYYIAYGLEPDSKGTYAFIRDNERRAQRMSILVAKLSETNNPIANKIYGLSFWTATQTEYKAALLDSKKGKGDKTMLSRETLAHFDHANKILRKLIKQIKIDFPKSEHKKVMREFGFLSEVYN